MNLSFGVIFQYGQSAIGQISIGATTDLKQKKV